MRKPVIAGNWKMYKTMGEALEYMRVLKPLVTGSTHCNIVVAPPFTALPALSERVEGSNIKLASQDVAAESGPGAFTGEVSAAMVFDAGARYAIVGHSERRQYYCETDASVNKKIGAALAVALTPIFCVGERLEERDSGRAQAVVTEQVSGGMRNLTPAEASRIIIAYEPVWAIGTGRTATPETAQEMHSIIRSKLCDTFGDETGSGIRILYGGSVKPENTAALMSQPDIDGALVGGASLEPESFARIVNYRS
ncbi:MAG TPA: triose-phosphate isomerase [Blastocatellia bacterium]|nr:triose-phosphate isomerase [Blastocatellia bacterium]